MEPKNHRIRSDKEIVLPKLSYKITGALFKVHSELGPSLLEKYYERALEKEFKNLRLSYKKQIRVPISYSEDKIGEYVLDFIVEDVVAIEIKAASEMPARFYKQTISYLKQLNLPLAILANFRRPKLVYKRFINPSFRDLDLGVIDSKFESIRE